MVLSERFVKHEVDLGIQRLRIWDLILSCPHSLKGLNFIKDIEHVQEDLMQAFSDDNIDMILAIGEDDTYRSLPYLFENDQLQRLSSQRCFLAYSVTWTTLCCWN